MSRENNDYKKRLEKLKKSGLASEKSIKIYDDRSREILAKKQEKFINEVTEENKKLKFQLNLLKLSLDEGLIIDPFKI